MTLRGQTKVEKKLTLVCKMTLGNWQIFTSALESIKIGTLMGSFNPKQKKYELKFYRGVMCHDNEEWCKLWRGIDLSFQNWHDEFEEFWLEQLKVSKFFVLMGSIWAKYILLELKSYRGAIFHDNEAGHKMWRGIDLSFQNWYEEFDKFWPEHSEVSPIFTLMSSIWKKYMFELKKYRGLISYEIKEWCKTWTKTDMWFGNDMRNLTNFNQSTWKSQSWDFDGILLFKVENVRA